MWKPWKPLAVPKSNTVGTVPKSNPKMVDKIDTPNTHNIYT
jgi:hypothetical protein